MRMHVTKQLSILLSLFLTAPSFAFGPSLHTIRDAISQRKTALYTLAGAAVAATASHTLMKTDYGAVNYGDPEYYWDWHTIDYSTVSFDDSFLFGVGTSAYQVEGDCINTDWYHWEQGQYEDGQPHVQHKSNEACDHWHKYKEDIALLKELGVDIYRFSLAWDKIEPAPGQFNQDAIAHYKEVCNELKAAGIKALIGFHHYTDPKWFADLGGFEYEKNIDYFVTYCTKVFQTFYDEHIEVELWSIFNSPTGYAFHKYHTGVFPPGIKGNKQLTMTVLKNMMEAHVRVYQAGKQINHAWQIGLLKNIMQLDPWRSWHPMDQFACDIATKMTDTAILNFFTTGIFKAKIPFDSAPLLANVEHTNMLAPHSIDFVGLNYYSHSYLKNMARLLHPYEILTANTNYTIYPEGLYRAIVKITNTLCKPVAAITGRSVPLYITENGIASHSNHHRKLFFQRYIYALNKAIQDGYDVKGYIYWSFMDNYEWGTYDKQYGLVHVDFDDPNLTRTIKTDEGTQYFLSLIQRD